MRGSYLVLKIVLRNPSFKHARQIDDICDCNEYSASGFQSEGIDSSLWPIRLVVERTLESCKSCKASDRVLDVSSQHMLLTVFHQALLGHADVVVYVVFSGGNNAAYLSRTHLDNLCSFCRLSSPRRPSSFISSVIDSTESR